MRLYIAAPSSLQSKSTYSQVKEEYLKSNEACRDDDDREIN